MYKNICLFMVALSITLFVVGIKPVLAEVYENVGGIVSDPVYMSDRDEYGAVYNRFKVKKILHRTYTDSSYSTRSYDGVMDIDSPYDVTGRQFWTCNSYFEDIYIGESGQQLGKLRFHATELKNPKCNSNVHTNESDSGSSEACANQICKCIQELNKTAEKINDSINSNGQKLDDVNGSIKENGGKLDAIKGVMDSIDNSLITDKNIMETDDALPDVPELSVPPVSGLPNDNNAFEDKEKHFEDAGDAPEKPGSMPDAPDVADCWDKTGDKTCKQDDGKAQDELEKDKEQSKDEEQKKDKEQEKDKEQSKDKEQEKDIEQSKDKEQEKDKEQSKDEEHSKDAENHKDLEMQKDRDLEKDREQSKDDVFSRDPIIGSDEFKQDGQMQQDNFNRDDVLSKDSYNQDGQMNQTHWYNKTEN
ncbi:hypothetical protein JFV29_13885 [Peribacillus sp. TH16]|uniref:hypothetical protein n=1 Tax=Peribacillus sp. TH16 TaxID=2798482 RepID=UPI001912CE47|nr:hypothetical protein [Peribacillus sp. TH16]MBK5482944.1 hypothetical protein [Peribacillus sp. TH16]MBK5482962.1 hypothetical protein [Peribacillus sp. TH16]